VEVRFSSGRKEGERGTARKRKNCVGVLGPLSQELEGKGRRPSWGRGGCPAKIGTERYSGGYTRGCRFQGARPNSLRWSHPHKGYMMERLTECLQPSLFTNARLNRPGHRGRTNRGPQRREVDVEASRNGRGRPRTKIVRSRLRQGCREGRGEWWDKIDNLIWARRESFQSSRLGPGY